MGTEVEEKTTGSMKMPGLGSRLCGGQPGISHGTKQSMWRLCAASSQGSYLSEVWPFFAVECLLEHRTLTRVLRSTYSEQKLRDNWVNRRIEPSLLKHTSDLGAPS